VSRIRRILHATDFSPASRAAFVKAVEMAKANRAELCLAHVISPVIPLAGDGYIPANVYEDIEASARAAAQKQLAALAGRARRGGVTRVRPILLEGVAAHEQINRAARARRADLVVIGTHGRTGLSKLFLGSVAGRVVSSARGPVLTVRGR
jgi:nucleotide-binding universal stress UspA family protein